jgi:AraC family transcriptional regulator
MTSMRLFRGEFGHVSVLNVASDLVTHAHPEVHIIIWLDGSAGEMHVGEHSIILGPRMAVGVNSLAPHSHSFDSGSRPGLFLAFYIDLNWARFRRGLRACAPLFRHPAIPIDDWLHRATVDLFNSLAIGPSGDDFVQYETERLIDSLMDAADAAHTPDATPIRAYPRPDYRVRKAIDLMKANVSERMSLDEVARSVGLSRPHFFSLFKEQTNLTPNVYWNTLRMEEALRQLESTEDPLTAVACNLGFTSQGNFTRFFRDHAGVPPTLYREAARAAG